MANFLIRQLQLGRRLQPVFEKNKRYMGIFTKEREPPNGFLFNEKVRHVANCTTELYMELVQLVSHFLSKFITFF